METTDMSSGKPLQAVIPERKARPYETNCLIIGREMLFATFFSVGVDKNVTEDGSGAVGANKKGRRSRGRFLLPF